MRRSGKPRSTRKPGQSAPAQQPPTGPGRYLLFAALATPLVLLIGLGAYSAGWQLWAQSHRRQAELALEQRDFATAYSHLALCLNVVPNSAETRFLTAQTARRAGQYDEALRQLRECERLGWMPEAIALERALLEAQQGELTHVEDYLLSGISSDNDAAVLILEALSQGYLKTYRFVDALHCLELWLKREPDLVQALLWKGEILERRGGSEKALELFRRALELDPQNDRVRLALAQALVRSDQTGEASPLLEDLRQREAANPIVVLGLARCRLSQGEIEEARSMLTRLLEAQPPHLEALCERGKLELQAGDAAAAEKWLRQALNQAPFDRDSLYLLYLTLNRRGRPEEAQQVLTRLEAVRADVQRLADLTRQIAAEPRNVAARHEAGILLLRNGQDQEGLRMLASVLRLAPDHRETRQVLADYSQRRSPGADPAKQRDQSPRK